ncbi:MAG: LPS export ABC transporter permease LptF [endosymbiont of Galathealinum brachiosum]|uniref:Lipopolysaccharide export system permease protein LptF n=1 Tax=endosymbiont of Galathealinum brachiosum TaxID=2200906 RepID=A0A370DJ35_9GAMM|nr:MAG: LPS export ABC transporter permease LptF [endosymbiont of Galathealinum brachiosum]
MLNRYFTIIDRYISRELLLTWLAVTLVLMLILLSGTLARLLGKAAEGVIPGDAVWALLLFTGARYLILLIPLSLYLGVLLSFSRLYKDNEMAALGACGVGLMRLYRPLLMVVLPVTGVMLYLTLFMMPWVSQQAELLKSEIENRSELTGLTAGRFNAAKKSDAIMFLQRQSDDGTEMFNVFLHQTNKNTKNKLLDNIESADVARRYKDEEGRSFIMFENGQTYEGEPGTSDFRITQYEKKGIYLPEQQLVRKVSRKKAVSTGDLWSSNRVDYRAELHWRLSLPIGAFLLAILALPLSYTTPRKGRYSKLALAILIYLIYSNLLGIGQSWVEKQKVPEWLGLWWVHGFAISLIIYWWLKRAGGIKQFLSQLKPRQLNSVVKTS